MNKKRVLVRADDLGYSKAVNYGIADTVRNGIIRSVGVMTNMPDVEHGLSLLQEMDVCFGLHTNICLGKPLCDPKLVPSLADENGMFKNSKAYRESEDDFVVLDEVILEIEAQYERFVKLIGHKPSYFEGHAVASKHFFEGLKIVATRHDCDVQLLTRDEFVPFRKTRLMVSMNSMEAKYDPFAELEKLAELEQEQDVVPLMICHPGYIDLYLADHSSLLVPRIKETAIFSEPELWNWINQHGIIPITYDDLD